MAQRGDRTEGGGPASPISRRSLLKGTAVSVVAAGAGGLLGSAVERSPAGTVELSGIQDLSLAEGHQPGIATPQQSQLCFAAFDLIPGIATRQVADLMRRWTVASRQMMRGAPLSTGERVPQVPPPDSGETIGLRPARLTVTFGVGPGLFESLPELGAKRPAQLAQVPAVARDQLDPARSGGDLAVQACSDNLSIAFHAIRKLTGLAAGVAEPRWSQRGFLPTQGEATPRNLMGFKDGTANPRPGDGAFDKVVWVQPGDGPSWLEGGSYLVARRVRIDLAAWDTTALSTQEATFGREKLGGSPLSGGSEFTPPNFNARSSQGAKYPDGAGASFAIDLDAHIRRAHSSFNDGARLLRRGYSFDDGVLSTPVEDGIVGNSAAQLDAGLFFLAYMRDPQQFITIHRSLSIGDRLNQYTSHVASAVFAIPPATTPGGFVGEGLLAT